MIIKGQARGRARQLAAHLLHAGQNEHIRLYECRGTLALDVEGALVEMESRAVAARTRQPLYHASISPEARTPLTDRQIGCAIDTLEQKLGLHGQPASSWCTSRTGGNTFTSCGPGSTLKPVRLSPPHGITAFTKQPRANSKRRLDTGPCREPTASERAGHRPDVPSGNMNTGKRSARAFRREASRPILPPSGRLQEVPRSFAPGWRRPVMSWRGAIDVFSL